MKSLVKQSRTETDWPPEKGEIISFAPSNSTGAETAILKEVRWGMVWRDFILEDERVIPEHRVAGCPQTRVWRNVHEVTEEERQEWEERLLSMAGSGMDPRKRDQPFWAELNQYLAYTYLRYKQADSKMVNREH